MSKKIQIGKKEIVKIIQENIEGFKKDHLEKFIGDDGDRHIQYPEVAGIEDPSDETTIPSEFDGGDGGESLEGLTGSDLTDRLKSSQSQLLEFLDKLEEAKSVLSKVAAKETDQEVKSKIYSYYERTQKVSFEMIKEFGVVH